MSHRKPWQKVLIPQELHYKARTSFCQITFTLGIIQWFSQQELRIIIIFWSVRTSITASHTSRSCAPTKAIITIRGRPEGCRLSDLYRQIQSGGNFYLYRGISVPLLLDSVGKRIDFHDHSGFRRSSYRSSDYLTGIGHREIGFFTGQEYIGETHPIRITEKPFIDYRGCTRFGFMSSISVEASSRFLPVMRWHAIWLTACGLPTAILQQAIRIAFARSFHWTMGSAFRRIFPS